MVMNQFTIQPISTAKKNRKIQQAIAESLESFELDKMVGEEKLAIQKERARDEGMAVIQANQERRQKEIEDKIALAQMEELNYKRIMPKAFGMIVFESLPIAPNVKQADSVGIYKYCEEVYNELLEAEIVNISDSPTFSEYSGVIQHKVADIRDKMTMKDIEGVLSDLTIDCAPSIKHLTRNVYEKAVDVISLEKKINNTRSELSESGRFVTDEKTLFRKLNESAITELTTGAESVELSKKGILEMALAESLLKYTILETLHTSKLIKIDPTAVRSVASFYL
jgi:hypothetical protein